MSTLWTPGGERPVSPAPAPEPDDLDELDGFEDLDPEQVTAMQAELAEARRQLASVPAEQVVANHLIGLYELGAIHLSQRPPNLVGASLAIDAMGAVLDRLGDRLGEATSTLADALAQIRLAYVQVRSAQP